MLLHSRRIAPAALLALFSLVSGGGTGAAAQTDFPEMTIKIYNNSDDTNIYPLISFPGQGSIKDGEPGDKWMQGFFGITQNRINIDKYDYLRGLPLSAARGTNSACVTRASKMQYTNSCGMGDSIGAAHGVKLLQQRCDVILRRMRRNTEAAGNQLV